MRDEFLLFRLPSGTDVSCPLDQTSITIGRDRSSDVVLDDPTISPHHAVVLVEPGRVRVIDESSEHGTFINDQRLEPDVGATATRTDRIRFGQIEARYMVSPTTAHTADAESEAPLRLNLVAEPEPVEPGWVSHGRVSVMHHGSEDDTFDISVTGVPESWVKLSAQTVNLAPGGVAGIRVNFSVLREEEDEAGEIPFTVTARSRNNPDLSAGVDGVLIVLKIDTMSLAVLPEHGRGPFQVALRSRVAERRTYRLSGEDFEQSLEYAFAPATLEVEGGADARSDLTVTPRVRPVFGTRSNHKFQVVATPTVPGVAPTKMVGEVTVTPKVSLGCVVLALVAGVLLVALYFQLCSLGNLPGCAAPDVSFGVTPAQLLEGETTTLAWQVSGAELVEILPALGAVGSSGTLSLMVTETTTYTLRAVGENGRASEQSLAVTVMGVPPLIEVYEAQPSSFVRGQDPDIVLSWSAPSADSVSISHVEGVHTASGSVTTTAPESTRTYTLIARNTSGSASADITVFVEEAGCVVASQGGAAVPLYEGPGEGYRTIGTLAPGTSVTPVSRSPNGDWAYVTVDNRNGWCRRQELSCQRSGELPTADPYTIPPMP